MRFRIASSFLLAGLAVVGNMSAIVAQGRDAGHSNDFGFAVRAGTTGIGVELSKLLVSHVGVRVGGGFFSYSKDGTDQDDITYNIKAKVQAFSALVDLYPGARGAFHLTGGLMTNPAKITAVGVPTGGQFEINDHVYNSSDVGTLTGTGKFGSVLPYVGLGIGTAASRNGGLAFVFDLGLAIGKPSIGIKASNAAAGSQLQQDLDAQVATTKKDLDKVPGYPILSIGLMYRF